MTTEQTPPDELSTFAELIGDEREFARRGSDLDPRVRRARRVRRLIVAVVVILVLFGVPGGYVGWALTSPLASPAVTWQELDPPVVPGVHIAIPSEGASAVSVAGADAFLGAEAGGIWMTSGTDDPRPIASITKLITALVVLDAKPLADANDPGPTVTFGKAAHDLYDKYYVMGATIAPMPTGTQMSLRDALATMLIPSASNYAEALSTWAFGSQWAFLGAARSWLAANGLTGTVIVEPTGLSPQNVSTPSDLIALGRLAASDPTIARIVATPSAVFEGPGPLLNTNALLGSNGITGLKTGNLGEGSYNLLYSATLEVGAAGPLTVIGVALGGATRDSVNHGVLALLDSIRGGFHDVPVAAGGEQVGSLATPWGESAVLVLDADASIFTWSDTPITVTMDRKTPVTYEDGEVVGSVTWTAGPNSTSVPIVIDGTIEPPTDWWRLTHPSELGG